MELTLENKLKLIEKAAKERHKRYMERCWIGPDEDKDGFVGWRWDKYNVNLKIVCAANRYKDFYLLGARHYDPLMISQASFVGIEALRIYAGDDYEQGFIDQYGTFHSRENAMKIAKAQNQVNTTDRNRCESDLFSEDLY